MSFKCPTRVVTCGHGIDTRAEERTMSRTQEELDVHQSTGADPIPATEPPIAPGQERFEAWFAGKMDNPWLMALRAEHHAEAWRGKWDTYSEAWRKRAQELVELISVQKRR
jgi:hypothetical protein